MGGKVMGSCTDHELGLARKRIAELEDAYERVVEYGIDQRKEIARLKAEIESLDGQVDRIAEDYQQEARRAVEAEAAVSEARDRAVAALGLISTNSSKTERAILIDAILDAAEERMAQSRGRYTLDPSRSESNLPKVRVVDPSTMDCPFPPEPGYEPIETGDVTLTHRGPKLTELKHPPEPEAKPFRVSRAALRGAIRSNVFVNGETGVGYVVVGGIEHATKKIEALIREAGGEVVDE